MKTLFHVAVLMLALTAVGCASVAPREIPPPPEEPSKWELILREAEAKQLEDEENRKSLAASAEREAAARAKAEEEAVRQAAEKSEAIAATTARLSQMKALVRARDLEGLISQWPDLGHLVARLRATGGFASLKGELGQFQNDVASMLIDLEFEQEKRGLTGSASYALWSVVSLLGPPIAEPRLLTTALDDKTDTAQGRFQRLLGWLVVQLVPAIEGPLGELPGWYRGPLIWMFSGLDKMWLMSEAFKMPTSTITVGPWEGRLTPQLTRQTRTSRYRGRVMTDDSQAIADWKAQVREAEAWIEELEPTLRDDVSPTARYETGQEGVYSGTGKDAVQLGTRGYVNRETAASVARRKQYEAGQDDRERKQAQNEGYRRSAAERLARLRANPPGQVLETKEQAWRYEAECQTWTGKLSRTVKVGDAVVTQSMPTASMQNCRVAADPAHNVAASGGWVSEEEARRAFVGPPDTALPPLFREARAAITADRIKARLALLKKKGLTKHELDREEQALRSLLLEGPGPLQPLVSDLLSE